MKRTGHHSSTPLWVKRLFMALAMIVALLGIVLVPALSYILVKAILDTIGVTENFVMFLGGTSALGIFIGYLCILCGTDMFGLSHQKNWK